MRSSKLASFLFAATILVGCTTRSERDNSLVPVNSFSASYETLNLETAFRLEEYSVFFLEGQILTDFGYDSQKNQLIAYVQTTGSLVGWEVQNGNLQFKTELVDSDILPIGISPQGTTLLGSYAKEDGLYYGIGMWDVGTGQLVTCLSHPCNATALAISGGVQNVLIDQEERFVLMSGGGGSVGLVDLQGYVATGVNVINNWDSGLQETIALLAIDTKNDRYAVILDTGVILVASVSRAPVEVGTLNDGTNQADWKSALFSKDGGHLVIWGNNELIVLNLAGGKAVKACSIMDRTGIQSIAITSDGGLVFVAVANRIRVIETLACDILVEFTVDDPVSMLLSQDDRLLFWGDRFGSIHLWVSVADDDRESYSIPVP